MTNDGFDPGNVPGTVDELRGAMEGLNRVTDQFGRTLTGAFARGIVSGKSFGDVLRGIGQRFVDMALSAAMKPAGSLLNGLFSGLSGSIGGALGGIRPFADGGIVGAPTYFPMSREIGLMGEAGPEAVMPLARGADGKLGVRGGGGVMVNVAISTPDAQSFRRSEAQVAATLAKAVARGQRSL
jgi:phage-related minor tail protein